MPVMLDLASKEKTERSWRGMWGPVSGNDEKAMGVPSGLDEGDCFTHLHLVFPLHPHEIQPELCCPSLFACRTAEGGGPAVVADGMFPLKP